MKSLKQSVVQFNLDLVPERFIIQYDILNDDEEVVESDQVILDVDTLTPEEAAVYNSFKELCLFKIGL